MWLGYGQRRTPGWLYREHDRLVPAPGRAHPPIHPRHPAQHLGVARRGEGLVIRTPDGVTRTGRSWSTTSRPAPRRSSPTPRAARRGGEQLSAEERARRERSRESGAGLVDFAVDETGRWAAFALSGQAWAVHLGRPAVTALPTVGAVIDPRVDPTGRHIAYASGGALRVVGVNGQGERALVEPSRRPRSGGRPSSSPPRRWTASADSGGHRTAARYWSSGTTRRPCRCGTSPIRSTPSASPSPSATPPPVPPTPTSLCGTSASTAAAPRSPGTATFEYLAGVTWTPHGEPVIQVMSRDQKRSQVLAVDVGTGPLPSCASSSITNGWRSPARRGSPTAPARRPRGRRREAAGSRRRRAHQRPTWQVRSIVSTHPDSVIATASQEPTEVQVVRFGLDGSAEPITTGPAVHSAVVGGPTTVIRVGTGPPVHHRHRSSGRGPPDHRGQRATAVRARGHPPARRAPCASHGGSVPRDHELGSSRLPVLMDPYGGPHAQRVLASSRMFLEPQWLADQGFCVVIADGRGTPGRGHAWERAVRNDLAAVSRPGDGARRGCRAVPRRRRPLTRGITGWSYGGYLAALAVLRRPDVFHVAVAGAPVTEWRLSTRPTPSATSATRTSSRTSTTATRCCRSRRPRASTPLRPRPRRRQRLCRTHSATFGCAARRRPPARGASLCLASPHMASQEVVAENLALLQVDFLHSSLR